MICDVWPLSLYFLSLSFSLFLFLFLSFSLSLLLFLSIRSLSVPWQYIAPYMFTVGMDYLLLQMYRFIFLTAKYHLDDLFCRISIKLHFPLNTPFLNEIYLVIYSSCLLCRVLYKGSQRFPILFFNHMIRKWKLWIVTVTCVLSWTD